MNNTNKSILHITNDFSGSKVYRNLFKEIDEMGISQIIYNPIRYGAEKGSNHINLHSSGSKIIYSEILNYVTDRLFFKVKIKKIFNDIINKVNFSTVQYIHAHTWYSDGCVAYFLFRKYNLPYVLTVRSTDVLVFHKYLLHHRALGRKIILNASKIIFTTPAYEKKFFRLWSKQTEVLSIKQKTELVPNGVDNYWLENTVQKYQNRNKKVDYNINVLCISSFIKRKNITLLQDAIIKINSETSLAVKLHIVGGGGDNRNGKSIIKKANKFPDLFVFHGKIKDKNKLMSLYRNSDIFALPSRRETFGLVYIEALTQGLPILYSNEDGIDGLFNENIGEKVSKFTVEEVEYKLITIIRNRNDYNIPIDKIRGDFNWENISKIYFSKIYKCLSVDN